MWCGVCNVDYKDGIAICPDCGTPLSEKPGLTWGKRDSTVGDWPVDENGGPVAPAFLAHRSGQNLDDVMLVGFLDAVEIPCVVRYPNDGEFGKLILGIPAGGADIYVPETMLESALALLRDAEGDTEGDVDDGGL